MQLPTTRTDIQIRYADIDTMGHVSNTVYPVYLEQARMDWFGMIEGAVLSVVIATITIDYLAEIRFGDRVEATVRCTKVGTKSVTLAQELYANGRCVTTATLVLVGFDPKTRQTIPLLSGWEPSATEG